MSKTTGSFLIIALLLLGGILYLLSRAPSAPDTSVWQTYTNTVYGYSLKYPPNALVAKISEEESGPIDQTRGLEISIPGSTTRIEIQAYPPRTDAYAEEYNKIIATPLEQFASTLRQYQLTDPNPNIKNRQVGILNSITFAGQKAYSFTLTKGFTDLGGGYTIPEGITYNYIVLENKDGIKLLLHYPLNDAVAGTMKDSFSLTK